MGIQPTNVVVMMTITDNTADLERKKDLVAVTKSFLYAINRQVMI
nr:ribosome recycling factor [Lactiplantibacillus plantarum]